MWRCRLLPGFGNPLHCFLLRRRRLFLGLSDNFLLDRRRWTLDAGFLGDVRNQLGCKNFLFSQCLCLFRFLDRRDRSSHRFMYRRGHHLLLACRFCAFNFSYWIFRERTEMLRYFATVYNNLGPDGVFFLDAFGGYKAFKEMKEKMKFKGFTYVWDQARYCPVTGTMQTHIHFRFPDGSRLKKAFSYEWRLWTLPELQELLLEAGFHNPTVRFEYFDEDGEGLGLWYPDDCGEASGAWIANITAEI